MRPKTISRWLVAMVMFFSLAPAVLLKAQTTTSGQCCQPAPPAINANELVRRAVANEVKANSDGVSMMFRVRRQTAKATQTREYVETREGTAGMLVAVDDKPLNAQQHQQEMARLENIVNNPAEIRKKQKQQKEDSERVLQMVKTLPDAFRYEYVGIEHSKEGDELVRLKFWPNPAFEPPSREQEVFTGMNGFLLIDTKRQRIARIDGTLFKDVNFGWGILGHLNQGGRFVVVQGPAAEGYWTTTHMQLNFTGKALLFKSIRIQEVEDSSGFRRVPNNLTFAQGIDLLKKEDGVLAENQSAATSDSARH